jgi:RNA polymerase sigma-70 factor, ECF subfamily
MDNHVVNTSSADQGIVDIPRIDCGNALAVTGSNHPQLDLYSLLSRCLYFRSELLWDEFIQRTRPVIARSILNALRLRRRAMPVLVEDLVQETYIKLFADDAKVLRRFVCRHQNALCGFLRVVAANTVQDYFRCSYSQKRGCGFEAESLEDTSPQADRSTAMKWGTSSVTIPDPDRHILLQQIETCLLKCGNKQTSARDWAIFWLYYREGLTAKAIAQHNSIGLSVKGIESTLLRLTRFIRLKMSIRSPGPDQKT